MRIDTLHLFLLLIVATGFCYSVNAFLPLGTCRHRRHHAISGRGRIRLKFYDNKESSLHKMVSLSATSVGDYYKIPFPPTSLKGEAPANANILSKDPLVYMIPNALTKEECQSYINRVEKLSLSDAREMAQSNPPDVSLNVGKLWPLPFLSLGAGIPPLIRILQDPTTSIDSNVALTMVIKPILLALVGSIMLAFGAIPLIQMFSDSSSRTSTAMALNLDEDTSFVRHFVELIEEQTGHPWYAWEAPVVTHYEPGAIFSRHGDASPTRGSEWADSGGQRIVTAICYLNSLDDSFGGETYFDQLNLSVKPECGNVLVFYPSNFDTLEADDRTTHESLPTADSKDKWIVQMFGRIGPRVPPPLGLPDSFETTQ